MCEVPVPSRWACSRLLSALRGRMSGSSGAQILEAMTRIYWGGRGRGGGAEDCQISSEEYDGDIISNVGRYRREWGGGEKDICVGGCIGSRKV